MCAEQSDRRPYRWLLAPVAAGLFAVLFAACTPAPPRGDSAASGDAPATAGSQTTSTGAAGTSPHNRLTDEQLADGWILLFDGETLFGWQANSRANWRVEDGAIVVDQGEKGLLNTTTRFSNYVLKVDFRSDPGTNSGIFLHTPPTPDDPATDCYELNIADADNPFPTGSLVQRKKVEGDYDSTAWQSYEITVAENKIQVKLDGRPVIEYVDQMPLRRGHIGLQWNEGRVAFRNLQLKPLSMDRMFNGVDLSGWKEYPEMASKFTVTEQGWLNVRDGRGQLETQRSYGDFIMQLECKTHAKHLNSGIFFRCIPGEIMNGYEVQIHNGYENGDRTQPIDCGTGGIFRRQHARRVVADDLEWFHMTIAADGPHFAAWVNGIQVSDWTDDRPADPNPRKGLRLEPGTIMIQGHDPTTDISFRNLQISELPARSAEH